MRVHDWLLRGLRAGDFKLYPSFESGKTVPHDPVRINRYDRILKAPKSCSERDLMYVLYGSNDKTNARRTCCLRVGKSMCVQDPELFEDGSFNPVHRNCTTIEDCRLQWDGIAAAQQDLVELPPREPAPWFPPTMTTEGFPLWALMFIKLLTLVSLYQGSTPVSFSQAVHSGFLAIYSVMRTRKVDTILYLPWS